MTPAPPQVPDHELLRVIGRGAYGEVWLARNLMGTHRAIKVIRRHAFHTGEPPEREYKGVTRFEPVSRTHESLVDVLQVGRLGDDGSFFYIMEVADDAERGQDIVAATYCPRTLREVLKQQGRLSFGECLELAVCIASALEHLHQRGLFHRDVKPSNIVFVNGIAKLADLGLVTGTDEARSFVGTEGFIPPEGPGSARADVFALGKVLYEASTGLDRLRFPEPRVGLDADPERDDLRELNEVILKACESDRAQRYATAAAMHQDLVLLQGGWSVRRMRRLERTWARLRVLLVVAGVLAITTFVWQRVRLISQQQRILVLTSDAERIGPRLPSAPTAGWRTNAIGLLGAAAAIRPDGVVRNHAATCLLGQDATVSRAIHVPGLAIAFEPGSERLFVDSVTNGACIYGPGADELQPLGISGHGPFAFPAGASPVQLVAEPDGAYSLWDLGRRERMHTVRLGSPPAVRAAVISPDATVAAACFAGDGGDRIGVWNGTSGQVLCQLNRGAVCLALSPDGSLLAAGAQKGQVTVYATAGGKEIGRVAPGWFGITALEFAWDPLSDMEGRLGHWMLGVGDAGGGATVWDPERGVLRSRFRGSSGAVTAIAFTPDGSTMASAGRECIRLWDVTSGRLMLRLPDADLVTDLAYSTDGRQLAATALGSFGHPLTGIFELEPDVGVQILRGLEAPVAKLVFSRNGRRVAAVASDWRVAVWDERGQVVRLLEVPRGFVYDNCALVFNADGTALAFAAGAEAGLWEVQSGRRIGSWTLPPGLVELLAITSDDRLLLFRVETLRGEVGPFGEVPATEHPRVCRIRELRPPDEIRLLAEIGLFNRGVNTAVAPADGSCFVVDGSHQEEGPRKRFVAAFASMTGEELWRRDCTVRGSWGLLQADPTSRLLCTMLDRENQASWLDLATGDIRQRGRPGALGPGGEWVAGEDPNLPGLILWDRRGTRELLKLGADYETSHAVVFSPDGRRVAWGTTAGVVLVADIPEVNRRLSGLGLGW